MTTDTSVLERLRRGNARFLERLRANDEESRSMLLPEGQKPFAVVLSCSDSRVPPELIFSQGFGELFVIRIAGPIVTPSILGSVEYAVEILGTRLVVVLGHTGCGAVAATVQAIDQAGGDRMSENLGSIIECIRPPVESVLADDEGSGTEDLLSRAVAANVRHSTRRLLDGSMILAESVEAGSVRVVGGVYSLESGAVEFLDSPGLGLSQRER